MRFTKKPVTIEATRFPEMPSGALISDYRRAIKSLADWCSSGMSEDSVSGDIEIRIATLEGVMVAKPGDWIIKGVKGEFYPCKPDIFEASYTAEVVASTDPIIENKQARKDLDDILQRLKNSPRKSRNRSLSVTHLEDSIIRLGMDLKDLSEPSPYPNSYNPANKTIDPTADGLKL